MSYSSDARQFLKEIKPLQYRLKKSEERLIGCLDEDVHSRYRQLKAEKALNALKFFDTTPCQGDPDDWVVDVLGEGIRESIKKDEAWGANLDQLSSRKRIIYETMLAAGNYSLDKNRIAFGLPWYHVPDSDRQALEHIGADVNDRGDTLAIYAPMCRYEGKAVRVFGMLNYGEVLERESFSEARSKHRMAVRNAARKVDKVAMDISGKLIGFILNRQGKEYERTDLSNGERLYHMSSDRMNWELVPTEWTSQEMKGKALEEAIENLPCVGMPGNINVYIKNWIRSGLDANTNHMFATSTFNGEYDIWFGSRPNHIENVVTKSRAFRRLIQETKEPVYRYYESYAEVASPLD